MYRLLYVALAVAGGLAFLTFGAALAQQKDAAKKKTAEQAASFEYPGAKRLDERNVGSSIYQRVLTTTDDLSKVTEWYDKKLAGPNKGSLGGVSIDGDGTRVAIFQDGKHPEQLAKRPVSTRSYLVRAKSHTVLVVISRPQGEKLTVVSVTYIPE